MLYFNNTLMILDKYSLKTHFHSSKKKINLVYRELKHFKEQLGVEYNLTPKNRLKNRFKIHRSNPNRRI